MAYLKIDTDLANDVLGLGDELFLLAIDQEETVGSPSSEDQTDELKDGGDERKAVDGADDVVSEIEGQKGAEANSDDGGLVLGCLPVSLDLVSNLGSPGVQVGHKLFAGLLDGLGGRFVGFAESADDERAARNTWRGMKRGRDGCWQRMNVMEEKSWMVWKKPLPTRVVLRIEALQ